MLLIIVNLNFLVSNRPSIEPLLGGKRNLKEQIYVQLLSRKRTNKERDINCSIMDSLFLTNTH